MSVRFARLREIGWLVANRWNAAAAVALCGAIALSGCAVLSVAQDVDQTPREVGAPASATLVPEGGAQCLTPCNIDLAGLPEEFELRINIEGFRPGRVVIRHLGDSWHADMVDLGAKPSLSINTATGMVSRVWFEDLRVRPDAAFLGGGETGHLYAVAVTESDPSQTVVLHLSRE